jgi:hypothetical protein
MDGCEFNPAPCSMGAQTFTLTKSGRDMRLTTNLHLMQGLRNFYRLYIQSTIRIHGVQWTTLPLPYVVRVPCNSSNAVEQNIPCVTRTIRNVQIQSDKINVAARGTYNYQRDENINFMQTLEFTPKIRLYYL